jgi:DNA mismatch endonuclease (patch repair protein)
MRRIRKLDSGPELAVRRLAHHLGLRYRLYRRDLPGTPDLAFPKLRKAIFVNGCFWHQHSGCRLARVPKTRLDYWLPKLERTARRDIASLSALDAVGWNALVVWECETTKPALLVAAAAFRTSDDSMRPMSPSRIRQLDLLRRLDEPQRCRAAIERRHAGGGVG